jgi:hypothetical protein
MMRWPAVVAAAVAFEVEVLGSMVVPFAAAAVRCMPGVIEAAAAATPLRDVYARAIR